METWIIYAIISMIFAGLTSVLAKVGLQNINADLGLGIRTFTIMIIVGFLIFSSNKINDLQYITTKQLFLLILSGITTSISWIFYYRAMKEGTVSYVASIDKASILITLMFSFAFLGEPITPKIIIGGIFIFIGLYILTIL